MNPASIRNLIDESRLLYNSASNNKQYTVPAFLSSWVAWEALRTRFIRVVIHQKGWLLKDADRVLAKKRISSTSAAASVICSLGLKHPDQWPKNSGKGWKALAEIEPLRHRLIHGFKAMDPEIVQAATKVVIRSVSNHDWLSTVPIVDAAKEKDRICVGLLLEPKRSSNMTHNRSIQELADILKVNLNEGKKSLPRLNRLEDMLKIFEDEDREKNSTLEAEVTSISGNG